MQSVGHLKVVADEAAAEDEEDEKETNHAALEAVVGGHCHTLILTLELHSNYKSNIFGGMLNNHNQYYLC